MLRRRLPGLCGTIFARLRAGVRFALAMSSGPLTVPAFIQNVSRMYCGQKLSERIYWTGVYDRRKHLFENMWPLPEGVSYNSYLIKDEKCALMDTVESGSDRSYLEIGRAHV